MGRYFGGADEAFGLGDAVIALDGVQGEVEAPCALQKSDSALAQGVDLLPALAGGGGLSPLGRGRARFRPAGAVRGDLLADGLGEVVPQVPAVADLDRVGQGSADCLGVGGRSVPAHGLDARMSAQPGFQRGGVAAGQYLDSLTGFGVDDDRGVAVPAPQGEVVDPDHPREPPLRHGHPPQQPQGGGVRHGHGQGSGESGGGPAA